MNHRTGVGLMWKRRFTLHINYVRGFTLIECILTLVIVAVAILIVMQAFPVFFRTIRRSRDISSATTLCQEKLEELKKIGYDKIFTYYHSYPGVVDTVGEYIRQWKITPEYKIQPGYPMERMVMATVTVRRLHGGDKLVELVTYLSRAEE